VKRDYPEVLEDLTRTIKWDIILDQNDPQAPYKSDKLSYTEKDLNTPILKGQGKFYLLAFGDQDVSIVVGEQDKETTLGELFKALKGQFYRFLNEDERKEANQFLDLDTLPPGTEPQMSDLLL
jgi:hypothetical protein